MQISGGRCLATSSVMASNSAADPRRSPRSKAVRLCARGQRLGLQIGFCQPGVLHKRTSLWTCKSNCILRTPPGVSSYGWTYRTSYARSFRDLKNIRMFSGCRQMTGDQGRVFLLRVRFECCGCSLSWSAFKELKVSHSSAGRRVKLWRGYGLLASNVNQLRYELVGG